MREFPGTPKCTNTFTIRQLINLLSKGKSLNFQFERFSFDGFLTRYKFYQKKVHTK